MEFIGCVARSFVVYLGCCFVFEYIRKKDPETSVQPVPSSPVQAERLEKQVSEGRQLAIINLCIGVLLLILVASTGLVKVNGTGSGISLAEFAKLAVMLFLSDTMFYWSHRLLHSGWFFRNAHYLHHQHNSPNVWTSLYVHPIEFVIALLSIFALPMMFFRRLHTLTATLFLCIVMFSLVASHSGLKIGSLFDASHHDLHHRKRRGNYGSDIGVWDKICGTDTGGDV